MKLATIRQADQTRAVRVDGDVAIDLGHADVGELLARPDWREHASGHPGRELPAAGLDYAPLVPRPEKIFCVGLNYRAHILETGRELPDHPTLFGKFARCMVGAHDEITLPAASARVDWEAELGIVIGTAVRHADAGRARAAIAGVTVVNDVSVRDWQFRTLQWLQGKTFEATTPVGPWLETRDDGADDFSYEMTCEVDGEVMQRADTGDLVFDPVALVSYISTIITLEPGDIIATGTPGGVGHARDPQRYLADGAVLTTRISGVGECRNVCRTEKP